MNLFDREHLHLVYFAHPFGGSLHNLDDAEWMIAELSAIFDAVFWAPWIPVCRYWKNEGNSLERGMLLDKHAVKMSHRIWFSDELSTGMKAEEVVAIENGIALSYFTRPQIIDIIQNPQSMLVQSLQQELSKDILVRSTIIV